MTSFIILCFIFIYRHKNARLIYNWDIFETCRFLILDTKINRKVGVN